MIQLLKRFFPRRIPVTHSSKRYERITEYEGAHIHRNLCCPDCGGALLRGPEGGCCINTCCEECGGEFNLTFLYETVIGERISDAGPRDVGDRESCYRGAIVR